MKIIFKDYYTKKIMDISLENIFLSENNPRFTLIDDFNLDFIKFIIGSNCKKHEKKTFRKLLESEEDFEEFKNLLESIKNNSFKNKNEPILLVESDNKEYIVAEGNRRISCLKLINSNLEMPQYRSFNETNEINEKTYDKCLEIISKIDDDITVYIKIVINKEELSSEIYNKHLMGERNGMKKWERSKYYADILKNFPEGILSKEDKIKNTSVLFNRKEKVIIENFKEAQFIYLCIYFGKEFNKSSNIEWNINEIFDIMIKQNRISSLERNHSFNKVSRILKKEILFISNDEFKNNYIEIWFDEHHRIHFKENRLKKEIFLKFLYKKWKEKIITTRDIKEEDYDEFIEDLKFIILNIENFNNSLTKEKLNSLNEFELSINKLDQVISVNKIEHGEEIVKRFINAKEIKTINKEFLNSLLKKNFPEEKLEPKNVFWILKKQYYYNSKENYLNAMASTLRSMIEQLSVWMHYSTLDKKDKNNWIIKMSEGQIDKCFREVRNKDNLTDYNIGKWLEYFCIKIPDENKKSIIAKLKTILKQRSKEIDILNSFVHASHSSYIKKNYSENINTLKEILIFTKDFYKSIDFTKFSEINEKIIKNISENSDD